MAVMLFKKGSEFVWEGLHLLSVIVDEAEVEAHKALGWVAHPHETIEVPEPEPAPPAVVVPPFVETPATPFVALDTSAAAAVPVAEPAAPVVPAAPTANPFAQ